jgi:UDP-galactopyranose mutase
MSLNFCVVGAGFSGAVIARALAERGHTVVVIDERSHLGGNCHTDRDAKTGVMTHRYGPHIFHTDKRDVYEYLCRFGDLVPYRHRVMAQVNGRIYSMPINLLTINQFFGTNLNPTEAKALLDKKRNRDIETPQNFEEQALSMVGDEIYRAFFRGYTCKQWGLDPTELPASILKRLPMRFNYDDGYFSHQYQAIPRNGYTDIVQKILDKSGIEVRLGCTFEEVDVSLFNHVIYSGAVDRYFGFDIGRLGYRTLDFETIYADDDAQGTAIMNYCDEGIPYTRITEHKHFSPWDNSKTGGSILYKEFSRTCGPSDVPYYPIRLVQEQALLKRYVERARSARGVTFVGRLGTYRYIDMDVTIGEALQTAEVICDATDRNKPIPSFVVDPL